MIKLLLTLPDSALIEAVTERCSVAESKPTACKPVRMPKNFFTRGPAARAIFFSPRGSPTSVIKSDIAARVTVDPVYAILELEVGKVLINETHPVGKEYVWPVGESKATLQFASPSWTERMQ